MNMVILSASPSASKTPKIDSEQRPFRNKPRRKANICICRDIRYNLMDFDWEPWCYAMRDHIADRP